jgi:hypothetical protein
MGRSMRLIRRNTNKPIQLMVWAVLGMAFFASQAFAGTYYVDYVGGADTNGGTSQAAPWKHAPGMTGASGNAAAYTPAGGDIFIFKGGVTWSASYPWTFKGGSGNVVTYTTDHSWFIGSGYTQPTFDAGHSGAQMASMSGGGYIALNDLNFVNCGTPQVANSIKCIQFTNVHDVTITNSTFATESWIGIYFVFSSAGSYSNFTWTGNNFSHASGAIWMATAAANTTVHNVIYNSNTFHDFASQLGGGVHGDGALHWFTAPQGDSTQFVNTLQFCNNTFYGDFRVSYSGGGGMTAFFYTEGGAQNLTICNNDMSFSPVQANMFDGLIVLSGSNSSAGTALIANNSLANVGTNAMSGGIELRGSWINATLKNNIVAGMDYPIAVQDTGSQSGFVSDYNLIDGSSGQLQWAASSLVTYLLWQSLGLDVHSVLGTSPQWISAPGNEDLQAASPARGAGANLTSLGIAMLNQDHAGVARPTTGAWDIGAYQYGSASASNPPAPPSGLTASVQ